MCLCSRSRVETVDIWAAGVVDEVLFGGADEVPQLVVPGIISLLLGFVVRWTDGGYSRNRNLERVVRLGG